jgi:hypothetical protein
VTAAARFRAFPLAGALVSFLAVGAAAEQMVEIEPRPGAKLRMLVERVPNATGTVILLAGNAGVLALDDQGRITSELRENQLVRARGDYAKAGLSYVVPDIATDLQSVQGPRFKREHAEDLGAVMAYAREIRRPIWLIGTSRGATSVIAAVTRQNKAMPRGIIITSGTLMGEGPSAERIGNLDKIRLPTLLVVHSSDSCQHSRASDAAAFAKLLTNAKVELKSLSGGGPSSGRADPCGASHYHGFKGIEDELLATIAGWIKANTASRE